MTNQSSAPRPRGFIEFGIGQLAGAVRGLAVYSQNRGGSYLRGICMVLLAAVVILEAVAAPVFAQDTPMQGQEKTCFLYSAYDYRTVGSEDGILIISMDGGDPIDVCRQNARLEPAWQVVSQSPEETQLGRAYLNGTRQCEAQASGLSMTVLTLSGGKGDGGYWCREINLPRSRGPHSALDDGSAWGEGLTDWNARVFLQGVVEFMNPGMNPNAAVNPNADSPFVKWYFGRYSQQVPANIYLQALLHGIPTTTSAASYYRDAMRVALSADSTTTLSMAHTNLNTLMDLERTIVGGGHLSNPDWEQRVAHVLYDPDATSALIDGQYLDGYGPAALSTFDQTLRSVSADYMQNGSQSTTPFLLYASGKIGLGS